MAQLEKRFIDGLKTLKDHIVKTTHAKQIGDEVVDGTRLASLAQFIASKINRDNYPKLPSLWDNWIKELTLQAPEESKIYFEQRLMDAIKESPPFGSAELLKEHDFILEMALKQYKSTLFEMVSIFFAK